MPLKNTPALQFVSKQPWKFLLIVILFSLVGLFNYHNGLHNGFLIDDEQFFKEDRVSYVKNKIERIFNPSLGEARWYEADAEIGYRPLSYYLPFICHLIFQKNPFGYHVFNLFFLVLVTFLIFLFIRKISKNENIALLAGFLFILHPINGLMVNYITASIFSLQITLSLISAFCVLKIPESQKPYGLYIGALLSMYAATLCHDTAFLIPALLTWLLMFHAKLNLKQALKITWPFFLLTAALLVLWFIKMHNFHQIFVEKARLNLSPVEYFAGVGQLLGWYFRQLFVADNIILMHVLGPRISVISGLLVWGLLLLTTLLIWIRGKKQMTLSLWGWGWFVLCLAPVFLGAKFQPTEGLSFEPHWLYTGSIGLFTIAAMEIEQAFQKNKVLVIAGLFLAAVFLMSVSHRLNKIWSSPVSYCEYLTRSNPTYRKGRFLLANAYLKAKELDKAEQYFMESFENTYGDWQIHNNLGMIADQKNDFEKALQLFDKALEISAHNPYILNNLSITLIRSDRLTEAENVLKQTIDINPWFFATRINLSNIYEKNGEFEKAVNTLKENLNLDPTHQHTILKLTEIVLKYKSPQESLAMLEPYAKAARDKNLWFRVAQFFAEKAFYREALLCYEQTLNIDPHDLDAHIDIGKIWMNLGRPDKSLAIWGEARKRHPNNRDLPFMMKTAQKILQDDKP